MLLEILKYPDERLSKVSHPVESFDEELVTLINNMQETMIANKGIGLAAPQVGVQKRVVIIAQSIIEALEKEEYEEETHELSCLVVVNPSLTLEGETIMYEEGCLSVPEYREEVPRRSKVSLQAYDQHGVAYELKAEGLLAVCIQHELDHLDGKLFIDRISFLKRSMYDKKRKKR